MSTLGWLTLVPVVLIGVQSIIMLVRPAVFRTWLKRFPRDVWSGRLLTALALLWAAWLLQEMALGRFETWKPMIWPAAIALGAFVWYYMDDLLAPRALGALLLLYPAPVLAAARLHPSPWRIVMSLLAYVCVVKGIALLLSPFWFRMAIERFLPSEVTCRAWGVVGVVVSLFLLLLAVAVY